MPTLSPNSLSILQQLHPELQRWLIELIKRYDFRVVEGPRTIEQQEIYHAAGLSRTPPSKSKHLMRPSEAVHLLPYPWQGSLDAPENLRRLSYFAGLGVEKAHAMGIPVRWGGDWDEDGDTTDQTFNDLMHFELDLPPAPVEDGA